MSRTRVLMIGRVLVVLLVVAVVVWGVAGNWAAISADLRRADLLSLAGAGGLAAAGTWLTMLGWRVLLADLGSPLHLAPAGGVFFVGQLGKYLPGSVWTVVAQADMAVRLQVPRRRTTVVGLLAIGLSVLTGVLVGLPAVPFLLRTGDSGGRAWVLLAVPVLVLLCWPALLNRVVSLGLHLLRRDPLEHTVSARAVLQTVALFVSAWVLFGAHVLVLAHAVADPAQTGPGLTTAALSGYALAASLGMLTVILPAGLGAREGVLTLVLAAAIPASAGTAVALLSRFLITVVDVVAALAGWAYARSHHLVPAAADTTPAEREP
ncbi:MAG: lysylphosphatidylglycerol synthase domain-containing protein [Lapillicoccus sp.]